MRGQVALGRRPGLGTLGVGTEKMGKAVCHLELS